MIRRLQLYDVISVKARHREMPAFRLRFDQAISTLARAAVSLQLPRHYVSRAFEKLRARSRQDFIHAEGIAEGRALPARRARRARRGQIGHASPARQGARPTISPSPREKYYYYAPAAKAFHTPCCCHWPSFDGYHEYYRIT